MHQHMRSIRFAYLCCFSARALRSVSVSSQFLAAGDMPRELWGCGRWGGWMRLSCCAQALWAPSVEIFIFLLCVLTYSSLLRSQWGIRRGKGEYCSTIWWGADRKQAKKSLLAQNLKILSLARLGFSSIFAFTFVMCTNTTNTTATRCYFSRSWN